MASEENTEATVRAARITATQAIIVAVITTFGGGVIGFLANQYGASNRANVAAEYSQRWLVIRNVEDSASRHVRIVASVNGLFFSYPSRAVWAETGPQMSSERFPLPNQDSYKVAFSAFVTSPGAPDTGEAESQEVVSIEAKQIPSGDKTYHLYRIERGYRDAVPSLRIVYAIE
jgi:hypothetical protein